MEGCGEAAPPAYPACGGQEAWRKAYSAPAAVEEQPVRGGPAALYPGRRPRTSCHPDGVMLV